MFIFLKEGWLDMIHSALGSIILTLPLELSYVLSLAWNPGHSPVNVHGVCCPVHLFLPSFNKGPLELGRPLSALWFATRLYDLFLYNIPKNHNLLLKAHISLPRNEECLCLEKEQFLETPRGKGPAWAGDVTWHPPPHLWYLTGLNEGSMGSCVDHLPACLAESRHSTNHHPSPLLGIVMPFHVLLYPTSNVN